MQFEEIDSWDTIVNYNNYFRLECRNWLTNQIIQLGVFDANGQPTHVEVDESYYFRRKYHRGRHWRGTWVIGLVTRETGHCWLQVVARRDVPKLDRLKTMFYWELLL